MIGLGLGLARAVRAWRDSFRRAWNESGSAVAAGFRATSAHERRGGRSLRDLVASFEDVGGATSLVAEILGGALVSFEDGVGARIPSAAKGWDGALPSFEDGVGARIRAAAEV